LNYQPSPINTSNVHLTPTILELTELLAAHTHDIWGQRRIRDGWTYGPTRDDAKKEHPCLVPYEDLPESEKKYDRDTAIETLKAIVALGYQITK
jgi:ryanodine receptor 2